MKEKAVPHGRRQKARACEGKRNWSASSPCEGVKWEIGRGHKCVLKATGRSRDCQASSSRGEESRE